MQNITDNENSLVALSPSSMKQLRLATQQLANSSAALDDLCQTSTHVSGGFRKSARRAGAHV